MSKLDVQINTVQDRIRMYNLRIEEARQRIESDTHLIAHTEKAREIDFETLRKLTEATND